MIQLRWLVKTDRREHYGRVRGDIAEALMAFDRNSRISLQYREIPDDLDTRKYDAGWQTVPIAYENEDRGIT